MLTKPLVAASYLIAGIAFCLAVMALAWFVNQNLIFLMAPGIPLVNAWARNPRLHNQELETLIFVVTNGVVWAFIFRTLVLGWRRWRAGGRDRVGAA